MRLNIGGLYHAKKEPVSIVEMGSKWATARIDRLQTSAFPKSVDFSCAPDLLPEWFLDEGLS